VIGQHELSDLVKTDSSPFSPLIAATKGSE